ncbi:MAG: hypothetical protein IJN54_01040 [Lachnospiraceae bacterium]|nr:hypothetical protein [Lachnospiraceae bacterium]
MMNSFKAQLKNVTKTKEQVSNEELEIFKSKIKNEYLLIKEKLLEMAQKGQYTVVNFQKEIVLNYDSALFESLISMTHKIIIVNRTLSNPNGDFCNEVDYEINEQEKYALFVDIIEKISKEDDISISPIMLKVDKHYSDKEFYQVPCSIHGVRLTTNSYQPVLRCVIRY